jgi:uncharacterized protein YkvS
VELLTNTVIKKINDEYIIFGTIFFFNYSNVLAVIELKQVLKIVGDLADYIDLGVTGVVEKGQWSGY